MKRPELYVSILPHIHSGRSVRRMMIETVIALVPALFAGWFFFGLDALKIVIISAISAVAAEFLWQKAVGRPVQIFDGSGCAV